MKEYGVSAANIKAFIDYRSTERFPGGFSRGDGGIIGTSTPGSGLKVDIDNHVGSLTRRARTVLSHLMASLLGVFEILFHCYFHRSLYFQSLFHF